MNNSVSMPATLTLIHALLKQNFRLQGC